MFKLTHRLSAHGLAFGLAVCYLCVLVNTNSWVGIPRDESIYFYAADRFADWFEASTQGKIDALSPQSLERGFKFNREHPMLMKSLFGLSHRYLHQRWGWIDDGILAYRLPSMLLATLAIYLSVLLAFALGGFWTALSAGLFLMSMPRLFFHAHLACFDLPVTCMWLLICYAYLQALQSFRWVIYSGILLGLGLATKLNTFFGKNDPD